MRVVTVAQMKQIEKLADANGVSYYQMMENAWHGSLSHSSAACAARKAHCCGCGKRK